MSEFIRSIRAYEVIVPCREGAINSEEYWPTDKIGRWDLMPICLLEFQFSDGIIGLGEVPRGNTLSGLSPQLQVLIGREVRGRNLVISENERVSLVSYLERLPPGWPMLSPQLFFALDTALLDRAGKRLGCRAVDVLGGAYRDRVAVDYWCGRQTPRDLEKVIERALEQGFSGLKMKSRLGDPVIEQARAVRRIAGDGFTLTIDPMFMWHSPHGMLSVMRQLEEVGGVRVEDPFPQDMPDFWRRARNAVSLPLIWHARDVTVLRRALQEECADDFNVGTGCLPLATFDTLAHAVEVAGHVCWRASMLELGVGQAAGLHSAAATRCCELASDFQSALLREHTLTTCDWPYEDGHLPLPSGDGIGVELDYAAIAQYQTGAATFD